MKAVIDRFEGDYAVLLAGDKERQIDMPRDLLPEGAREGSCITISLELDTQREARQRERMEGMLEKLKRKHPRED